MLNIAGPLALALDLEKSILVTPIILKPTSALIFSPVLANLMLFDYKTLKMELINSSLPS